MVDVIIRDELVKALEPALPRSRWHFVTTQRTVDVVTKPTVVLRQERIERDPASPSTIRRAFFALVLASELDDTGAAEAKLDDEVVDILGILDDLAGVVWTTCSKGIWSEQNPSPCYVVELSVPYGKQKEG